MQRSDASANEPRACAETSGLQAHPVLRWSMRGAVKARLWMESSRASCQGGAPSTEDQTPLKWPSFSRFSSASPAEASSPSAQGVQLQRRHCRALRRRRGPLRVSLPRARARPRPRGATLRLRAALAGRIAAPHCHSSGLLAEHRGERCRPRGLGLCEGGARTAHKATRALASQVPAAGGSRGRAFAGRRTPRVARRSRRPLAMLPLLVRLLSPLLAARARRRATSSYRLRFGHRRPVLLEAVVVEAAVVNRPVVPLGGGVLASISSRGGRRCRPHRSRSAWSPQGGCRGRLPKERDQSRRGRRLNHHRCRGRTCRDAPWPPLHGKSLLGQVGIRANWRCMK